MVGRADRGLFITTGTFAPATMKEVTWDGAPPIDLLDGSDVADKLRELTKSRRADRKHRSGPY
jgi:restriction system protein